MSFDEIGDLCKKSFPGMEKARSHILSSSEILKEIKDASAEQKEAQLELLPKLGISGKTNENIAEGARGCAKAWQEKDHKDSIDAYTRVAIDTAEERLLGAIADPHSPKFRGKPYAIVGNEYSKLAFPGTSYFVKDSNIHYGAPPRINREAQEQVNQIVTGINKKYSDIHAEVANVDPENSIEAFAVIVTARK